MQFSLVVAILAALSVADAKSYLDAVQKMERPKSNRSSDQNPLFDFADSDGSGGGSQAKPLGPYLKALRSGISNQGSSDPRINRPVVPNYRVTSLRGLSQCKTNYKFDYLMLSLQWAPGFCDTSPKKCVIPPKPKFTIHGMWPQSNNGEDPEFCCFDDTFDVRQLDSIRAALEEYWFSYFSPNSVGFWSHEWLKHGTCLRDLERLQGEKRYFGGTVDIVRKLPILKTLKDDKIVPGEGAGNDYYSLSIINALRPLVGGKSVSIDCDYEHSRSIPVMTGIKVCLDANLKFVDCTPKSRCRDKVSFRL